MFPKYFTPCSLPPPVSLSSPPPLLWSSLSSLSCLNSSSAAAELLQLARKSKERSEQQEMLAQSPPSPSPPPRSPSSISLSSGYKPLLKFSVNAILSRDESGEEETKPLLEPPVSPLSPGPPPGQFSSSQTTPGPPSPGFCSPGLGLPGGGSVVSRPFLAHHPILPPHLHPLLYQHSNIPRTGFTLPGSATTLFPLPGTFPWSAGFRGRKSFAVFSKGKIGFNLYTFILIKISVRLRLFSQLGVKSAKINFKDIFHILKIYFDVPIIAQVLK